MRYFLKSLLVLALTPALSHAAYSLENINADCSEALTIRQGAGVSFQCLGNFSLTGDGDAARLWSDRSITLSATGDLSLSHLSIVAPQIQLFSPGPLFIGNDVTLNTGGGSVILTRGGDVSLQPSTLGMTDASAGTLTLDGGASHLTWDVRPAGAVPEPTTWFLMLVGVSVVLLRRRLG